MDEEAPSDSGSVSIEVVGAEMRFASGRVGTVTEERDATGEHLQIRTRTPEGARSDEQLADGVLSLNIYGPTQAGSKGEPRAIGILLGRLRQEGHQVSLDPHWENERGEDGILLFRNERLTLQVVTVPSIPVLWKNAKLGSAKTSVSVTDAANWIREAVVAKFTVTSPAECARTIIVLDAALAGILSAHEVVDTYLGLYEDPKIEFGLASIWLVGPTTSTTIRIGTGRL